MLQCNMLDRRNKVRVVHAEFCAWDVGTLVKESGDAGIESWHPGWHACIARSTSGESPAQLHAPHRHVFETQNMKSPTPHKVRIRTTDKE